jgi:hypothetical protein
VYSHKNLITELEVFPKDFHNYLRLDHDTYSHILSLVTPFIAEEDTVMATHTRSKRLGKSGLKAGKRIDFVRDFCVSPPTAASRTPPHVEEFLKA